MNKKFIGMAAILLIALFIFGCTQSTPSGIDQVKAEINSTWVDDGVNAGTTLDNAGPQADTTNTWVDTGEIAIGDMV